MLQLESRQGVRLCSGLSRRDFLRVGGLSLGLGLAELTRLQHLGAASRNTEKACIQINLLGGPSQLETWDLKPNAPASMRGPFRPIRTSVPGIAICEHFPKMARIADRFAIVRSVHHQEAPIHETGHQLIQTGRLSSANIEWPHPGAVLSRLRSAVSGMPSWVVLPRPVGNTGVSIGHGQTAGFLGDRHEPLVLHTDWCDGFGDLHQSVDVCHRQMEQAGQFADPSLDAILHPHAKRAFRLSEESDATRSRYGWSTFGQSCLLARRLIEGGVRLVTVNMFDTVFGQITWDCHADGGDLSTTLDDYRDTLCPMLDAAYTALLDDLHASGLLDTTLVVCAGEFGRTPRLNSRGGRDHWPGVWSVLLAGGGVRGGQVVGASDGEAAYPSIRPVHASEIAATVYHALGINGKTKLPGPDGQPVALIDAEPVRELF